MVRLIRAAMGYQKIPVGFPILVSERMSIIERHLLFDRARHDPAIARG